MMKTKHGGTKYVRYSEGYTIVHVCDTEVKLYVWNLIQLKRLAYMLYGSVASLPSPSSNIEAWPNGTSLRFASLLHLGH